MQVFYLLQLVKFSQANKAKRNRSFASIFGNNLETWKGFIKEFGSGSFVNVIDKAGARSRAIERKLNRRYRRNRLRLTLSTGDKC